MIPKTLLEPMHQPVQRPPLFLRLTHRALDGISNNEPLRIEVTGASAKLMVGDLELAGSFQPDPGSFEVFAANKSVYRSYGPVEKRLVLREAAFSSARSESEAKPASRLKSQTSAGNSGLEVSLGNPPAAATSTSGACASAAARASIGSSGSAGSGMATRKKQPSPKHRPLVHTAALGATTPAALARTTGVPVEEARDFLVAFATPADTGRTGAGDPFIMNDDVFLYVRPWEHQYEEDVRKRAIDNCKAALDRMEIGPEHTARKSLKKPKVSPNSSISGPSSSSSAAPSAAPGAPSAAAVAAATQKKKPKSIKALTKTKTRPKMEPADISTSTPPKRPADLSQPPRKRASIASQTKPSQDLETVAQKFHKTYSHYANLYKTIESTPERSRDASQVKKLLSMHHELAEWKSLLWSSVDT